VKIMKVNNNEIEKNYFPKMNRCTKCILPETFPGISFDENGVCKYCHNAIEFSVKGEGELERLLNKYRNKGDKYDCIVGLSGGRDSAYILYQIVKKYKMRALALTYDSGFITSEGERNIAKTTEVLGVKRVVLRDEKKIETAKENVKLKFHGWLKKPSINTIVPVLNSGDKTMNLQIANYANANNIPLVIGGNIIGTSAFEHDHFKTGFLGVFPDDYGKYTKYDTFKLLFLFAIEYLKNPNNLKFSILKEYLEGIVGYFFEAALRPKNVDSIGFYDFIHWNERSIVTTIIQELDWKGAPDTTTTWRIDDGAYPLINYLYYKLVGFTEHDEIYSKMIRDGQITREDAIVKCDSDRRPRVPTLLKDFEELDVTKEQVDKVLIRYRKIILPNVIKNFYSEVIIE